ncbi:MAG: hypothetical protein ACE5OS_08715 [Anaerolineae bacterium]
MFRRLWQLAGLSAVLLLTGCITLDVQNIINADGSGEKVAITAMDTDTYEMITSMTPEEGGEVEDPLQSTWELCEAEPRATCETYVDEENELTGVRASMTFGSLDELVELSDNPIFGETDAISFEHSSDMTTMYITVNTQSMASEVAESSGEMEATSEPEATLTPEEEEMQRQILEAMDINFYYRVTAPAPVSDYGPQENGTYDEAENTVTWDIDLSAEEPSQELWLTWGGAPIEATEEPTPTVELVATEEPTATEEPPAPPPTEAGELPIAPPPAEEEKKGPSICCLPTFALPALSLGAVLVACRRRSA